MCLPSRPPHNQLTQKIGKKRLRREQIVHFSDDVGYFGNAPDTEIRVATDHDSTSMWYSPQELTSFKLEARAFIMGTKTSIETRGFEKYNIESADRKQMARRCIVLASKKGMSIEQIALVSRRLSQKTKGQAFKRACQDYCEVYEPTLVGVLSNLDAGVALKSTSGMMHSCGSDPILEEPKRSAKRPRLQ